MTEFQWVVDNMPGSALFADSLFGLAAAQAALGEHAAATKLYSQILDKHAGEKSLAIRAKYGRAVANVQQGDYKSAAADLRDYLKTAEKGSQTSEARYLLGYALAAEKNYDEAITTLQALLKDDPQYAQTDKVLYELAWAQQSADKKEAARDTFAKLAKDFPKSPHAAESLINVGDYAYQEKKDYAAAAEAYDKSLQAGAADSLGESALHMLGWSLFNQMILPMRASALRSKSRSFRRARNWPMARSWPASRSLSKTNTKPHYRNWNKLRLWN